MIFTANSSPITDRLNSIDIVRGIVILLMALDHTRDFWGMTAFQPEDPTVTSPAWFFTRWLTHLCAPAFIFLSGVSSYIHEKKLGSKNKLARFLLIRGVWLIVAEIIIVNPGWTFQFPWQSGIIMLQVIWALGWSMIVLAAVIYLDIRITLFICVITISSHNSFDMSPSQGALLHPFLKFLHIPFAEIQFLKHPEITGIVVYPLIPWVAVMCLGYVSARLYHIDMEERRLLMLLIAVTCLFLFFLFRMFNFYGDPNLWEDHHSAQRVILDILDITKYPPSFHYLLAMLGFTFLLLGLTENKIGLLARTAMVYGKVPFFFYLIHTPIINASARIYHYFKYGTAFSFVGTGDPWPEAYKPSLRLVYVVWFILIIVLYYLCRWYGRYKRTHNYPWLKYI